ncbi:XdhC family protein [Octadecabacter ascidiaceicola]|nr:XdhC family protein [Octadecabacter ascidiaceicola]
MTAINSAQPDTRDPLLALAVGEVLGVLALVIRTEGPSYRSVGASMVFADDGNRIGSLSSGCIESDLALHAEQTRADSTPRRILYGRGSPYVDIQLPCGGGLEILLLPQPQPSELSLIAKVVTDRQPIDLSIAMDSGRISQDQLSQTGIAGDNFTLHLTPPLRFVVFGKGPEATTFTRLVQSLGYHGALISPDAETLGIPPVQGWDMHEIRSSICPEYVSLDDRTAVLFFFHDHEWEAPILSELLDQQTFYVGCQGSLQASETRRAELSQLGVAAENIEKIRGPIGLIPSVRDSSVLAVSVLAEILALP